jgi:integrase
MKLGQGKATPEALVFSNFDGEPIRPNNLSRRWIEVMRAYKLPPVPFHALRHTHASSLIAAGVDVLKISRRLGHASASITLNVYGHLFQADDGKAVAAIEAALRASVEYE